LDGTGLELEASPLSSTNESILSLNGRRSAGVQLDRHLQNSDIDNVWKARRRRNPALRAPQTSLGKVTAGIVYAVKDDPESRAGMVDVAGSGGRETKHFQR
jgi:hypothetical protein